MGTYAEQAVAPDLRSHLRCSWTTVTRAGGMVLPDGCLDLMWIDGELVVAGPDTAATPSGLRHGLEVAAVRFRPGVAPAVLGLPASALRDSRVPLAELWPGAGRLARQVGDSGDRVAVLEAAIRRRLADAPPPDPVAVAVAGRLQRRSGGVGGLADRAGLSERQLHRRCLTAFGYGAKTLDRVLRLQRFLALGRASPSTGLAELAVTAGYTDQAHLGHDTRALAAATPAELLPGREVLPRRRPSPRDTCRRPG
ncbi:MAG TPA: helix-turn-helix domain-containing protein [Mycobacteriales bacterium]|nr:helix-turn-helix domain-containing protein [Mycobacteriales bacterium]